MTKARTNRWYVLTGVGLFLLLSTNTALAEVNADARYRSGAAVNILDHAGVRKAGVGIYEIKGAGHEVQISSWDSFLADRTYLGGFWNPTENTSNMSAILSTCAALDAEPGITYTWNDCMNTSSNPGSYVTVDEITAIRCDALVEYSYEWNGVQVWGRTTNGLNTGTPYYYDISYAPYVGYHNNLGTLPWFELSPRVQRGGAGVQWTKLRGVPYS